MLALFLVLCHERCGHVAVAVNKSEAKAGELCRALLGLIDRVCGNIGGDGWGGEAKAPARGR